jgi:hypothetical protein
MTTLSPHELHRDLRDLARRAIACGFTIGRTRSGHMTWRAPNGGIYFSGSTPSDWRAVRNLRSWLLRHGLER